MWQAWESREIHSFGGETGQTDRQIRVERPRQRWKDNIKTYLKEIKLDSVGWINLTQDMD